MTVSKLFEWMGSQTSRTLWISSPPRSLPSESVSGARAAALSAIVSAWELEHPIISHFCVRPHPDDISEGLDIEQAGLIGLVYSLIDQLQETNADEGSTGISSTEMNALDGSRASWSTGLSVLKALLRQTPRLTHCVIDGLNELEWGDGTEWCKDFLNLLRHHQGEQPFNILLTTTGQSKLLARELSFEQRYIAQDRRVTIMTSIHPPM